VKSKLAVLVELLPWLSSNQGASLKDTASAFEMSEQKVLELLQLAVLTGPGQGGGELVDIDFEDAESLFVSDAKGLDRPIRLSAETATTVIGGLHYLMQLPGLVNLKDVQSLLAKLQNAFNISDELIELKVDNQVKVVTEILSEAIVGKFSARIEYFSANTEKITNRVIDPKSLVMANDITYVSAWCQTALDNRLFRLDRISTCEILEQLQETAAQKAEINPLEVSKSIPVLLRCDLIASADFDQKSVISSKHLTKDLVEIEVLVHNLDWVAREILGSNGRIIALEPPELVKLIADRISIWQELNS
jgi:proteasome accessory factor C